MTRTGALFSRLVSPFGRLVSLSFARYLAVFLAGIGATLAWQSYSSAARTTIAGWSPHLAWVAPAAPSRGMSQKQIKATSAALAAVHQSVDKLESEIDRLEAQASSENASPSRRSRNR